MWNPNLTVSLIQILSTSEIRILLKYTVTWIKAREVYAKILASSQHGGEPREAWSAVWRDANILHIL